MTVRELIENLSTFPPDLPVTVNGGLNERANGTEAANVHLWHQVTEPDAPRWCYGWLDRAEDYADTSLGVYQTRDVVNIYGGEKHDR